MKITIWERLKKDTKVFEHNHIENGDIFEDAPIPKSEIQKSAWKGAVWKRTFGYLINNVVYVRGVPSQ